MKVALITGAGTGIGRGTALALAAAGVAVVGVGRRMEKLKEVKAAAGDKGDLFEPLAADVTLDDTPARAVELAMSRFGRLDYLVNNAGIGRPKPLHETDDATLDANLNLMLRAPFRLTREALKVMEPGSAIVNVASTHAIIGGLRSGAYQVAKTGLVGLTLHVACQYGSNGIRCNAVAPGVIPTEMTEGRFEDEMFKRINNDMTPSPRLGTVEDVAGTIFFLCSDAAGWINGQIIAIDGGWSATKFLSEQALVAQRTEVVPPFTHSGKPLPKS